MCRNERVGSLAITLIDVQDFRLEVETFGCCYGWRSGCRAQAAGNLFGNGILRGTCLRVHASSS
jgi:hypothetical protein